MAFASFGESVEHLQRPSEVVMRFGAVRLEQDRFFEVLQRLGGTVQRVQRDPEIVVRLGKIRIPLDDARIKRTASSKAPCCRRRMPS